MRLKDVSKIKNCPESVRVIVRQADEPSYAFESAIRELPTEQIPALVNQLARIARERSRKPMYTASGGESAK